MKQNRDPQASAQASAQAGAQSGADPAGRVAGLLGMARRAGRLTTGFDAVAALAAGGTAAVVLAAADLSEKTEKELRFASRNHPSPFLRLSLTKEELGRILGLKKPVGVLALEDRGFAASLIKLAEQGASAEPPCSRKAAVRTVRKDDRSI